MDREGKSEEKVEGRGPYEKTTFPPGEYVGDFNEILLEWPTVPCDTELCCCCINAGIFETICIREASIPTPCSFVFSKGVNADGNTNFGGCSRLMLLGRAGWRVCLLMAFLPFALPFRTCAQHRSIRDLYPVGSRAEVRNITASVCLHYY